MESFCIPIRISVRCECKLIFSENSFDFFPGKFRFSPSLANPKAIWNQVEWNVNKNRNLESLIEKADQKSLRIGSKNSRRTLESKWNVYIFYIYIYRSPLIVCLYVNVSSFRFLSLYLSRSWYRGNGDEEEEEDEDEDANYVRNRGRKAEI